MSIRIHELAPLFEQVQERPVFPDSKTFVDCIPRLPLAEILALYEREKHLPGFSLADFISLYFERPRVFGDGHSIHPSATVEEHIASLWPVLTRPPVLEENSSLIPLPFSYVVPGGRFGEIYYWDSYFTMLGLAVSGRMDAVRDMVQNFAYLLDTIGYIPNGNRTYYLGRSQPPFFSLMVELLESHGDPDADRRYLPQLLTEYEFWMKGRDHLSMNKNAIAQVVRMPGGEILNRYYDEQRLPRPESYREDRELQEISHQADTYHHLRAGAASGWDFSSRWFRDPKDLATIHTADFVPVDLNCLLYLLEKKIAVGSTKAGDKEAGWKYARLAEHRKTALLEYAWNDSLSFFTDYNWADNRPSTSLTLAACFPLFVSIASPEQAQQVARRLETDFLRDGGLLTTLEETGQQWDAPNGWAPLQWIAVNGLLNYGYRELADTIRQRWLRLNSDVFRRTGKMMEKYNVVQPQLEAGGGEYPGQDGFGWTNGVYLALTHLSI